MKRILTIFITGIIILAGIHSVHAAELNTKNVTVFFNEACQDCGHLVKEKYPVLFGEYGYSLDLRDYINERENRGILNEFNQQWGVPFELQSHIEAFVGDRLLIGGHVPEETMRYVLENTDVYDRLLIYQDKMHGEETDYKVWDFEGEIKTYAIDEPITTYFQEQDSAHGKAKMLPKSRSFWGLFAVITGSAFLDGLNPCAFAVLLFFIAFLYTIKRTKASIWKMGLTYIFAIYLAYFLIGIGLAQAFIISGAPHLMAKIGAYLVIVLGVIQLLGAIYPKFPIRLRIPLDTKATLEKWLYKATLPASFIGGFIVGLCTFPCSGGIYVAIIGLLASSQTYLTGLGWMVWYNLIFVLPLIIMLLLSSSARATDHLQRWERSSAKLTKIIIGLTMIALGAIILIFFT
jgi:cytochrome c biogenesis protein CcdA